MVNTQYLESKIKKSGKTKTYLADKLNCHINTLIKKINNKSDFKSNEIQILCEEVYITYDEVPLTFFYQESDNLET